MACGSKAPCPKGMATATFSSGTEVDPEQQEEVTGGDTEDSQDWPDMEETIQGVAGSSKSKGETGDQPQQAEGGAQAPPKEIPPAPEPSNPKPGTSRDPTCDPTDAPAKDPTQDPTQPPTTQNKLPPRNLRKIHQHLQNMLKHTDRQASYG